MLSSLMSPPPPSRHNLFQCNIKLGSILTAMQRESIPLTSMRGNNIPLVNKRTRYAGSDCTCLAKAWENNVKYAPPLPPGERRGVQHSWGGLILCFWEKLLLKWHEGRAQISGAIWVHRLKPQNLLPYNFSQKALCLRLTGLTGNVTLKYSQYLWRGTHEIRNNKSIKLLFWSPSPDVKPHLLL